MRSTSPRGCVRGFGVGFLLAASVYDLLVAAGFGSALWPPLTVLLVGSAAVLWPVDRRPGWFTPQLRTAVPAVVSGLFTTGVLLAGRAECRSGRARWRSCSACCS